MDTDPKPAALLPGPTPVPMRPTPPIQQVARQTPPPLRRSKADSLRLAARLKRAMMALTTLGFGAFSVAIGAHLATTATTSISSNTTPTSSTSTPTSSSHNGSYFTSGGSNVGTAGSSSSSPSGTVGGSNVS